MVDYIGELGGFAEDPEVIDGDEEEYIAFNYCLASDYLNAFIGEAFDEIGDIDGFLLNDVANWYCYFYYPTEENKRVIDSLMDCSIMTVNGRTLAEAIFDKKAIYCASAFLQKGSIRKDLLKYLYATLFLYSDSYVYIDLDVSKYVDELFTFIDDIYKQEEDKIELLNLINNRLKSIRVPHDAKAVEVSKKYTFASALSGMNK